MNAGLRLLTEHPDIGCKTCEPDNPRFQNDDWWKCRQCSLKYIEILMRDGRFSVELADLTNPDGRSVNPQSVNSY